MVYILVVTVSTEVEFLISTLFTSSIQVSRNIYVTTHRSRIGVAEATMLRLLSLIQFFYFFSNLLFKCWRNSTLHYEASQRLTGDGITLTNLFPNKHTTMSAKCCSHQRPQRKSSEDGLSNSDLVIMKHVRSPGMKGAQSCGRWQKCRTKTSPTGRPKATAR
jgi:hypothetical protein